MNDLTPEKQAMHVEFIEELRKDAAMLHSQLEFLTTQRDEEQNAYADALREPGETYDYVYQRIRAREAALTEKIEQISRIYCCH